jgi:DNA-binding MarR family transcriptional regulator
VSIKVNPDGSFEVNSVEEAVQLSAIIKGTQPTEKQLETARLRSQSMTQAAEKVEGTPLNRLQYRTWEYLVENDNPEGTHVSQVGRSFGISRTTANTRLLVLERMGYAKRVAKGYYRALEGGS